MSHLSRAQIAAWCERTLAPDELLAVDTHLAWCHDCRRTLAGGARLDDRSRALMRRLQADAHVDFETMTAWVDRTIDTGSATIVASHLDRCEVCALECRDLEDLRDGQLGPSGDGSVRPWWTRVRDALTGPAIPHLAWAAPAVVLLALAILWSRAEPFVDIDDSVGRFRLLPSGTIDAPIDVSEEQRRALVAAMFDGRLYLPAEVHRLAGSPGALLNGSPDDAGFVAVAPVATISSSRPTFRWSSLRGAIAYDVLIHDGGGGFVLQVAGIAPAPEADDVSWTVTDDLQQGVEYQWQVVAHDAQGRTWVAPAPPHPEARFRTATAQDAAALEAALVTCSESHLLRALTYARFGMIDSARLELLELRALNDGEAATIEAIDRTLRRLTARFDP